MSERRPPGISYDSWIERRISRARDRGEFDDLPGAGKPIPDLGRPHDANWWIKRKLRDEGLSYVPSVLAVRKRAEEALVAVARADSELAVRRIVAGINEEIRACLRTPTVGLQADVAPLDVEQVVRDWREGRST